MGHKDQTQLLIDLEELKKKIAIGDKFYHYKHSDQLYHILAIGFIEDTETPCVVYEAEYGHKTAWVRTESEFFAKVTLEDGTVVDRFTKVV